MSPITATTSTAASVRAATALGERFRSQLADAIGAHRFGLWFEHGTTIEIAEKSAVIRAANSYVHEWIVRHFGSHLAAVTRAVLGEDATFEVTLATLAELAPTAPIHRPSTAQVVRAEANEQSGLRAATDDPRRRPAPGGAPTHGVPGARTTRCLLYTSDAADE